MTQYANCNLCGCDDYKVVYAGARSKGDDAEIQKYTITDHAPGVPARIVKCRKCGLIYANPRPSDSTLLSNYIHMVDELYVDEEEGRRMSAREVLKALAKLRKGGLLLEIGCAAGFLLDEARKAEWDVYGVELSEWAAQYAKDKSGINNIFRGTLEKSGHKDDFFDAILMLDTIEHLADPKAALIEMHRILRPDGIICINTPDIDSFISRILKARWWGVKRSHLYYFNRRTLEAMLDATGFKAIVYGPYVRAFTLSYWAGRIKGYSRILYAILMLLARYRIIGRGILRINMHDQITVFAKRKK